MRALQDLAFSEYLFSKYCVFVFPSQMFSIFFLKKFFSWLEFISPVFISCVVLFIFSFILLVVSLISIHFLYQVPLFCWLVSRGVCVVSFPC